jgi:hypothetical protein
MRQIPPSAPKSTIQLARNADQHEVETLKTMTSIDTLRQSMPLLSVEEIVSARHEGHKY